MVSDVCKSNRCWRERTVPLTVRSSSLVSCLTGIQSAVKGAAVHLAIREETFRTSSGSPLAHGLGLRLSQTRYHAAAD